jgi:hypothetical protein
LDEKTNKKMKKKEENEMEFDERNPILSSPQPALNGSMSSTREDMRSMQGTLST